MSRDDAGSLMRSRPESPRPVATAQATAPHGHYSQAMRCGNLLFVSGILGAGPTAESGTAPQVEAQVRDCLMQIERIVAAAGGDRRSIAKVGVFATDVALWPRINSQFAEFFGEHRPARIIVPCPGLRFDSLVEMDAIASV